jgi:hypothetical protein
VEDSSFPASDRRRTSTGPLVMASFAATRR